jgi:hypothetical protein
LQAAHSTDHVMNPIFEMRSETLDMIKDLSNDILVSPRNWDVWANKIISEYTNSLTLLDKKMGVEMTSFVTDYISCNMQFTKNWSCNGMFRKNSHE